MMLIGCFISTIIAGLCFDAGRYGLVFAFVAIAVILLVGAGIKYLNGEYGRE